jgi:hypothetical protein
MLEYVPINNNSMFLSPSTAGELSLIINSLKNTRDLIDIPSLVLKLGSNYLSNIISDLYNLSLQEGNYPDILKIAKIVPIFKKGDKTRLENYRPISILPIVDKIFEKLTLNRLNSFTSANEILCNNQHGFRHVYSTDTALIDMLRLVLPAFSKKSIAIAVFIDYSKAFDTVDHSKLLDKLERYGVRGLSLDYFRSYLENRYLYVNYHSVSSDKITVSTSVPQGSCLGPALYNLYTNDVNYYLDDIPKVAYADDTVFVAVGNDMNMLAEFVNNRLEKLSDWCKFNRLCININKTKFMVFSPLRLAERPVIKLNNDNLEEVNNFKYLGVLIDNKLNFNDHINVVNGKLSRLSGISYRLSVFQLANCKNFYFSIVVPNIVYGIITWGGNLINTTRLMRTQRYQNNIVKNLFCTHFEDCSVNQILKKLEILNVKDLYKLKCAEFVYKIIVLNKYPLFKENITESCIQTGHETRQRTDNQLRPSLPRINVIKFSFQYQFILIWNNIPEFIRDATSLNIMKKMFKKFLVGCY